MPSGIYKRTKKHKINWFKKEHRYYPSKNGENSSWFKSGHFGYWLGTKGFWFGKKRPEISGENNCNWNNGSSFKPYSISWTKTLKRTIRERDNYICQICGEESATFVHHKDYKKLNCNSENLITLCNSCHTKTNYNRDWWIVYWEKRKALENLLMESGILKQFQRAYIPK